MNNNTKSRFKKLNGPKRRELQRQSKPRNSWNTTGKCGNCRKGKD